MVIRPNACTARVYPFPSEIAGGQPSPWFKAAESPFRWFSQPTLPGLLWLHRAALCSEIAGRWRRADFYRKEFDAHFAKLAKKSGGLGVELVALSGRVGRPAPADAAEAGRQFVDELLIDTHAALCNSFAGVPDAAAQTRIDYHLARIKARLPDSGMTPPERASLLRPSVRVAARSAASSARWSDAAAQYRDLLDADPGDREAQDGVVNALWQRVVNALGTENSESAARREAAALDPVIREMEALTDRLADHADFYDALAQTHLIQAVRLANSSQLPEALAAIEKAVASRPGWDEAESVRKQLREMMVAMQERVRAIDAQLRASPNATLNAAGLHMKGQAVKGFGMAQQFAASDRAKQLAACSERARARRFWLRLGLAEPDRDWSATALLLMNALGAILTLQPSAREEIEAHWDAAVAGEPRIAAVDREKILPFLNHRLLGETWEPAAPPVQEVEEPGGAPLTVPLRRLSSKPDGAPFGDWLHSGQDRGLKRRLALAALAMFVAVGFAWREQVLFAKRDRAFAAVAEAAREQDDTGAMQAAAEFLSAHPFAEDSRESEIVTAYQRAFVHWISGLHGDFRPEHQSAVDRYRQLVAERKIP